MTVTSSVIPNDRSVSPEGQAESDRVLRAYDFRLPESIERAHLRSLRMLFEVFTHRAGGVISARLRSRVSVNLGELEQHSWDDYVSTLPETTCLISVGLLPLSGRVVLHLPLTLAMTIVDLTLGGNGQGTAPERALSDIEQQLIGEFAEAIIEELPAVFAPLVSLRTVSFAQISSPQFLPTVRPTDMGLVITQTIDLGEGLVFPFDLCFPFTVIHPITDALANQDIDESPVETADAAAVRERILDAPVVISVMFPSTILTPVEFLELAIGDVIRFPYQKDAPLSLAAGGQPFLEVLPVSRGKRLACIITDPEENQP